VTRSSSPEPTSRVDLGGLRAAAALSLTGRYSVPGRQAGDGLTAWARSRGVDLRIEDDRSDPARTGRLYRHLAVDADLLFGPYGSGPTRAAARELSGSPAVLWNHGGAAISVAGARVVSVLPPAERYWTGLAPVLVADGIAVDRVAVLHAATGFGRATAAGALASLRVAGTGPLMASAFTHDSAAEVVDRALAAGAQAVVGCGRIEDDIALGLALTGRGVAVGLTVCGIGLAAERLGPAVSGWFGPAVWWPGGPPPPIALPAGSDYPAAQALATGLIAERALAAAGTTAPDAMWAAATSLRSATFLGPFATDAAGRQVALAPFLVRWVPRDGALERVPAWSPSATGS
jgi:branched-chain amino acid transport system substrate-binding protein